MCCDAVPQMSFPAALRIVRDVDRFNAISRAPATRKRESGEVRSADRELRNASAPPDGGRRNRRSSHRYRGRSPLKPQVRSQSVKIGGRVERIDDHAVPTGRVQCATDQCFRALIISGDHRTNLFEQSPGSPERVLRRTIGAVQHSRVLRRPLQRPGEHVSPVSAEGLGGRGCQRPAGRSTVMEPRRWQTLRRRARSARGRTNLVSVVSSLKSEFLIQRAARPGVASSRTGRFDGLALKAAAKVTACQRPDLGPPGSTSIIAIHEKPP